MRILIYVRFFFGKNKVMQIALGKSEEGEVKENLAAVSEVRAHLQKCRVKHSAS